MSRRGPGKPFQPGNKFGKGRPSNYELAKAREVCGPYTQEAVDCLVEIIRHGKSEMARITAADKILDRVWGKPTQPVAGDAEMPAVKLEIQGVRDVVLGRLAAKEKP